MCVNLCVFVCVCVCVCVCAELKREIRMWERAEKTLPTVTGEEKVIRDALKAKTKEVRKQLHNERKLRWVCPHPYVCAYRALSI